MQVPLAKRGVRLAALLPSTLGGRCGGCCWVPGCTCLPGAQHMPAAAAGPQSAYWLLGPANGNRGVEQTHELWCCILVIWPLPAMLHAGSPWHAARRHLAVSCTESPLGTCRRQGTHCPQPAAPCCTIRHRHATCATMPVAGAADGCGRCHAPRFLPKPTTTFTKRRLYFRRFMARPLGCRAWQERRAAAVAGQVGG